MPHALHHHSVLRRLVLATVSLTLFLAPATAQTQVQRGVARMITRSKSDAVVPVSGVRVVVGSAASKASDAKGRFTVNVTKNKAGSFQLKDVRVPQGSALILASPRCGDNCYLNAGELVLAFTTAEDKEQQYKTLYRQLYKKYNQQRNQLQQLRDQLKEQRIELDEGSEAYQRLTARIDSAQVLLNQYFDEKKQESATKELQRIAEQLAVTDYQSLDSLDRRIYELKTAGDWPTLSKLLLEQMRGDAAAYIKESVEQKNAAKAIYDRAAQEFTHRLALLNDAIEAFKMQHLNDSVSHFYEILVAADSTNFDEICNAGMFELEYTARYDRALTYFEQALRSTDIDTLRATAYNNLGLLFRNQSDYEHAEECHQKALEIRLNAFGEQHPDVARSYNNLGLLHFDQGDKTRAEECFRKSLKIRRNIFGEQHRDVAVSYNNLGMIYYTKGDYEHAEEHYRKANTILLNVLNEQHPDVARSYDNLGTIYLVKRDTVRAAEYFQKALDIQRAIFGERHPDVARSYNYLGNTYAIKQDYARASEFFQKAADIAKSILGAQNPNTRVYQKSLDIVRRRMEVQK